MRDIKSILSAAAVLFATFVGSVPLANGQAHRPEGVCPPGFDPNCVAGKPAFPDIPAFQRKKLEDSVRERQSGANPEGPPAQPPSAQPPSAPNIDLSERARLAEVQGSNAPAEEQARVACRNLFAATYRVRESDMIWTTVARTSDTPGIFSFRQQRVYFQVNAVGNTETFSYPLSPADALNKIQNKGSVTFRGSAYRTGLANMSDTQIQWTPWKDLGGNKGRFAICYFEIRDGSARIAATNEILGAKFDKLSQPE